MERCDCISCKGDGVVGPDGAACSCVKAGCRKRHRVDDWIDGVRASFDRGDVAVTIDEMGRSLYRRLDRSAVTMSRELQVQVWHNMEGVDILRRDLVKLFQTEAARRSFGPQVHDLHQEINALRAAIRKHRDATTGQSMCWENDRDLWGILGEPDPTEHAPPRWLRFLWNCVKYRWGRGGCPRCRRPAFERGHTVGPPT